MEAGKALAGSVRISIEGMTCGHCVNHVKEELNALVGVEDITVDLDPKGISVATVALSEEVTDTQLKEAIDEAGYDITQIERL